MVLYFFSVYRFSALRAEKRYTQKIGTYLRQKEKRNYRSNRKIACRSPVRWKPNHSYKRWASVL
jgi:hypothetical protein